MQKKYSLNYLLAKQPGKMKKSSEFRNLLIFYNSTPELKKIFISKKCYLLLNNAKIKPENLEYFYKTYRLPKAAFFPMFLKIKSDHINRKNILKKQKEDFILNNLKKLDDDVLVYLKYFSRYERLINKHKKIPLWMKSFYPKSKKSVSIILKMNKINWIEKFSKYSLDLIRYYRNSDQSYLKKLINLFTLELPIKKFSDEEIKSQFRKLSKKYHPDLGGNSIIFKQICRAKDEIFSS